MGEIDMSRTDADIAAELAPAGLHFVERDHAEVRFPVNAANFGLGSRKDDPRLGAVRSEVVDIDDPCRIYKLNAGWYLLATESGLFTEHREFLLKVDYADPGDVPELAWVRVQLLDRWDIAGSGVAALGSYDAPEFTVLSVNGRVLMRTTMWGDGRIGTLVIPCPATTSIIRDYIERMAYNPRYSSTVRQAARTWLMSR
jgi:hypothetical protein